MSKHVLLSDIHSNYPSLQAVVDKEGKNVKYSILGDIVGLLSYPSETVSLIKELDTETVLLGNHDRAIFHEGVGHVNSMKLSEFELTHTINNLSHEQIDIMQELPFIEVWEDGPHTNCAAHAKPWAAEASGYESGNAGVWKKDVPHVASTVADSYDFVLLGHTHQQYSLDCSQFGNPVTFVNPGSLGWNDTYSILDKATGDVEHKSVEGEYKRKSVKEHIQRLLPEDAPHTREWF
jgi:predicted phosphodiesterase